MKSFKLDNEGKPENIVWKNYNTETFEHIPEYIVPILLRSIAAKSPKMYSGTRPGRVRFFIDLRRVSKTVPTGPQEAPGGPRRPLGGPSLAQHCKDFRTSTLCSTRLQANLAHRGTLL